MNNSTRAWLPSGLDYPPLAVIAPQAPDRPGFRSLLQRKLEALIAEDPKGAQRALEASRESSPEMWAIAESVPPQEWAGAILRSDSMNALLGPANWEGTWQVLPPENVSLAQIVELLN